MNNNDDSYIRCIARVLIQIFRWLLVRNKRRRMTTLIGLFLFYATVWIWVILPSSHPHAHELDDLGNMYSTSQEKHSQPFFQNFFWKEKSTIHTENEFSACLLIMDDNHYLIEWLAYHYHALNLRHLIVVTDPQSQTSPYSILKRWKSDDLGNLMDITEWTDRNFMTQQEFLEAQKGVWNDFGGWANISPRLVSHRARQRMFYYKCLLEFKQSHHDFVLLTDTDEFVRVNEQAVNEWNMTAQSMDQPGAVANFIHLHARGSPKKSLRSSQQAVAVEAAAPPPPPSLKENQPLFILQSSPCIQIPRIRFGAVEEEDAITEEQDKGSSHNLLVPREYNESHFLTQKWRTHTQPHDYKKNKISKAIIDLSRVSRKDLLPVDSIHLPIRNLCQQSRLYLNKSQSLNSQSLLVVNHYLGSYEQYTYRENDARLGKEKSMAQWQLNQNIENPQTDDDIRPWLSGFHKQHQDDNLAVQLLQDVGQLELKSWKTYHGDPNTERCALLFFGLPRAYRNMVLPSIVKNLLIPNARHNCDVYVHFYEQYQEAAGRKNRGGRVDPREIFLLEQAVHSVQRKYGPKPEHGGRNVRVPHVAYTYDTEEQFWQKRGDAIKKYHTTVNPDDGLPAYYPWAAKTYTNSSLDNIVKQWHSVEFAFKLMDVTARRQLNVTYSRVGMFRSDAMYLTPIDIALTDNTNQETDSQNQHVVVAPFASLPINDRMIYGPYEAVKIWSSKRFELIEERVEARKDPGYEMHSERFLNGSIFPAIQALGYQVAINRDICFVRTRADESAMVTDCTVGGTTRGWGKMDKKKLVEDIVQRNCTYYKMGFKWTFVGCGEGIKYVDGK